MNAARTVMPSLQWIGRALLQSLKPRNLLRGLWMWIKQKLVFWLLISPVVFVLATIYHVYLQGFKMGGWNDAPGRLIQPDVWMQAAMRWTGVPAFVTGALAFMRSIGLGSLKQIFKSLHTVPAGVTAVIACLRQQTPTLRTWEQILIATGAGALGGDVLLRLLPTTVVLSVAVMLLLRGFGLAGDISSRTPLKIDLSWGGWLVSVAGGLGGMLSWLYLGFYGTLALIAGAVLWYRRTHPAPPTPPTTLICLLTFGFAVIALADDGSWDEFSPQRGQPKTISGYLATKDGQKIVQLGLVGGTLAAFGSMFGSLLGTMLGQGFKEQLGELQGGAPPPMDATPPTIPGAVPDAAAAEAERIRQSISQLENEFSESRRQADYYRGKLAEGDPRQRDFYQSQIRFHESNASNYRDNINALKSDGILHHTRTDLDEFNLRAEDPGIREAREKWERSRAELAETQREKAERERQELIDEINEGLNREVTERDVTVEASRGITKDLLSLWKSATSADSWQYAWDLGIKPTLDSLANTAHDLTHVRDSLVKVKDFYVGEVDRDKLTGDLKKGGIVPVLAEWAGRTTVDPSQGGIEFAKFCSDTLVKPIHEIVDPKLTIQERLLALGKVEFDLALGEAVGAVAKAGGRVANRALGIADEAAVASTALADEVAAGAAKPSKSLGTLRREAFEETRRLFAERTEMMERMNNIADELKKIDGLDDLAAQQQALDAQRRALADLKKTDASTFNLVKKEVHPSTFRTIEEASASLNNDILSKAAKELEAKGFKVEVKLAGNPGGADCDAFWSITDKNGVALTERQAGKLADSTVKGVVERDFSHLGASADDLGLKTMNGSPEKFPFNPNEARVATFDGKLGPDGKIHFTPGEKTGPQWGRDPWKMRPGERVGQGAVTPEGVKSLGTVLETKTEKIIKLGAEARPADILDAAREIVKTDIRLTTPLADRVTAMLPAEYSEFLSKCRLALSGDLGASALPHASEWNRILQDGVRAIERNLPK